MRGFFEEAARLEASATPFVIITLVAGRGHIPQNLGAKALVTERGLAFGTVGGGKVEARAIREAQRLLQEGETKPLTATWNLQLDLGMSCGGEMSFLFEPRSVRSWNVAIYGAGHVGQALVRVLLQTEARITCVEARAEWREKLPEHPRLHLRDWAQPAQHLAELASSTFHVSVTQGHAFDVPILRAISQVHAEAPYVGVIGSRPKAAKIRSELLELGCSAQFIEKIRCPIGLPIGDNNPGEIAISVAAELLKCRDELPKLAHETQASS